MEHNDFNSYVIVMIMWFGTIATEFSGSYWFYISLGYSFKSWTLYNVRNNLFNV